MWGTLIDIIYWLMVLIASAVNFLGGILSIIQYASEKNTDSKRVQEITELASVATGKSSGKREIIEFDRSKIEEKGTFEYSIWQFAKNIPKAYIHDSYFLFYPEGVIAYERMKEKLSVGILVTSSLVGIVLIIVSIAVEDKRIAFLLTLSIVLALFAAWHIRNRTKSIINTCFDYIQFLESNRIRRRLEFVKEVG